MQGGSQLVRSDLKRLDEVRRIREAMASGNPVLVDKEKGEITEYVRILDVNGEMMMERLLAQIEEQVGPPVAVMKMIDWYVSKLGKEAALHKLSLDLEEEAAPEREAQLGQMEAEVESYAKRLTRATWPVSCKGTAGRPAGQLLRRTGCCLR